ncbi:hypothetical protein [Natrinema sp. HArc-T2]|uniref:hypothetical protein n=1 Tax=Natrinema sp. HArc-T2 TaxID=3242701 RepID=UPI00359ECF19
MSLVVVTLEDLVHGQRANAVIGWVLTGIVALSAIWNGLTAALLWCGLALLVVVVASLPALATRDWTAMLPWPVLSVAAIAVIARGVGLSPEAAGYLIVATLALIVVVELEVFTSIELSRRFAVAFAGMTTMALQALWTVAQFYSDRWFGTAFLHSQTELQQDIVVVTLVGFVLGGLFEWYLTRFEPAGSIGRATNSTGPT